MRQKIGDGPCSSRQGRAPLCPALREGLLKDDRGSEDKSKNVTTTNYSDFRSVDGIIFPFKLQLQGQKISISEIIVNEEIKDSSF